MRYWIVWLSGLITAAWTFASVWLVTMKCGTTVPRLLACGSLNELGDFIGGMTAPLAFIWLFVTVVLQMQQLAEQRREINRMSDQANATAAAATFEAELATFANRLIAHDNIWNFAFNTARLLYDRTAYETNDDALTIMKAEAALHNGLRGYAKDFTENSGRLLFLHEGDVDEFLATWSSLKKLAAAAANAPPAFRSVIEGLNLDRFVENMETIILGSSPQIQLNPDYADMTLPRI